MTALLAPFLSRWAAQTGVARGIVMMMLSTVAFAIMHAAIRKTTQDLPPIEVAFFRNILGLVALAPVFAVQGISVLRTTRFGLHALRSVFNIAAMILFFTALSITELGTVTALGFTAPIFAAILSVLFLGERFRMRRWAAILAGFLGVVIIVRPGVVALDQGALMVIASAIIWAVALILIKVLGRTDSSVTIVAWMGIFLTVYSAIPAWFVWVAPAPHHWPWLIAIGVSGTIAQVTISQSLKETDPGAVMPFDFLRLIWVTLLGAWLFGEFPDLYTWIGASVIFSAGLYIAHRERREARLAVRGAGD